MARRKRLVVAVESSDEDDDEEEEEEPKQEAQPQDDAMQDEGEKVVQEEEEEEEQAAGNAAEERAAIAVLNVEARTHPLLLYGLLRSFVAVVLIDTAMDFVEQRLPSRTASGGDSQRRLVDAYRDGVSEMAAALAFQRYLNPALGYQVVLKQGVDAVQKASVFDELLRWAGGEERVDAMLDRVFLAVRTPYLLLENAKRRHNRYDQDLIAVWMQHLASVAARAAPTMTQKQALEDRVSRIASRMPHGVVAYLFRSIKRGRLQRTGDTNRARLRTDFDDNVAENTAGFLEWYIYDDDDDSEKKQASGAEAAESEEKKPEKKQSKKQAKKEETQAKAEAERRQREEQHVPKATSFKKKKR
jgi:hypothetical protein